MYKIFIYIVLIIILLSIIIYIVKYKNVNKILKTEHFENRIFKPEKCIIKNLDKYWTNHYNSDIAIVTAYTQEIYQYSKYSIENIKYYCAKQKYKLYIFSKHICKQINPCWYKIILIRKLLPKYKYLIWIDSDAIITNPTIRFETFIDNRNELFVCRDINHNRTPFNSGVMIFKNTLNVKHFLTIVWNYDQIHGYTPNGDQDILNKVIFKDNYPIKIKLYDMNYFNSHPRYYKPNDFIIHLMVRATQKRIQIMSEFNNYLNINRNPKTSQHISCITNRKCLSEHTFNCGCSICKQL